MEDGVEAADTRWMTTGTVFVKPVQTVTDLRICTLTNNTRLHIRSDGAGITQW